MKKTEHETLWPSAESVEKLRMNLLKRISHEQLKAALYPRPAGSAEIVEMNPVDFHELWVQPLLDAGLSLEAAIGCIVQSYLQPN